MTHGLEHMPASLLARYDRPGPRYTSYPTAVEFHDGVTDADYVARLTAADALADEPLSLYVHLPFCRERCAFCGCNVVIAPHAGPAEGYLTYLHREIDLLAAHLPSRRSVSQLHLGGGTPTYYSAAQLQSLCGRLFSHFRLTSDAEVGVEVDPRVTTPDQLTALRGLGFNRLSLGVQDFTPQVQAAIGRVQSVEQTRALVLHAREIGFTSINVDLIYGLPHQTGHTFGETVRRVLELRPERVAVYSFAFVPWMKAHMKHLPLAGLPEGEAKLALLLVARQAFLDAGYRAIGMDHFALPQDELSRALDRRALHRNFMGYTVQSARDMVALGVSGIGDLQGLFAQNAKKLTDYYEALDAGRLPVARGYARSSDDEIRRYVITELMCNGHLDVPDVERRFGIRFDDYFAAELEALRAPGAPADDGLVEVKAEALVVTPTGRMFVRNVCMVFDRYLTGRTADAKPVFSRTV